MTTPLPSTSIYAAKRWLYAQLSALSYPEGANGTPEVFYGPPTQTAGREVICITDPDVPATDEPTALALNKPREERFDLIVWVDCGGPTFTAIEADERADELLAEVLTAIREAQIGRASCRERV